MEDFKNNKVLPIVKQFTAGGDRYEINGIDLSKAVFFWKVPYEKFKTIPKGSYTILTEGGNTFLVVQDAAILGAASEYQVCYEFELKSSTYDDDFPDIAILKEKYNQVVGDLKEMVLTFGKQGFNLDDITGASVLPKLVNDTFWYMEDGEVKLKQFDFLDDKYLNLIESAIIPMVKEEIIKLQEAIINGAGGAYIPKVNTVAELQQTNRFKPGDVVEVLGYYSAGDGAGHKRKIEATDDESGIQLADGLWANVVHNGEVNVSWFGAKGDGVADDTVAIQKALDTGIAQVLIDIKKPRFKNLKLKPLQTLEGENQVVYNEIADDEYFVRMNFRTRLKHIKLVTEKSTNGYFVKIDNKIIVNERPFPQSDANIIVEDVAFMTNNVFKSNGVHVLNDINNGIWGITFRNILASLYEGDYFVFERTIDAGKEPWINSVFIVDSTFNGGSNVVKAIHNNLSGTKNIDCLEDYTISNCSWQVSSNSENFLDVEYCRNWKISKVMCWDYGKTPSSDHPYGGRYINTIDYNTCFYFDIDDYSIGNGFGFHATRAKKVYYVELSDNAYLNNPTKFYDFYYRKKMIDPTFAPAPKSGSVYSVRELLAFPSSTIVSGSKIGLPNSSYRVVKENEMALAVPFNVSTDFEKIDIEGIYILNKRDSYSEVERTLTLSSWTLLPSSGVFPTKTFVYQVKTAGLSGEETVTLPSVIQGRTGNYSVHVSVGMGASELATRKPVFSVHSKTSTNFKLCFSIESGNLNGYNVIITVCAVDTVASSYTNFTNRELEAGILKKLDTPYYATKMQQEGIYTDYITYRDELHECEQEQKLIEAKRQEAYQLALESNADLSYEEWLSSQPATIPLEEPRPSQALIEFKEKYLG